MIGRARLKRLLLGRRRPWAAVRQPTFATASSSSSGGGGGGGGENEDKTPLHALSLLQAARGLEGGDFTSVELTEACLLRVEEVEGGASDGTHLNAFTAITAEEARAAAEASDARRQRGEP